MTLNGHSEQVVWLLSREQADAIVQLGCALEPWIRKDSPLDLATLKLDEQTAAQMRNPYDEAEDELRDRLAYTMHDYQFESLPFDILARAVVDRILGVYS